VQPAESTTVGKVGEGEGENDNRSSRGGEEEAGPPPTAPREAHPESSGSQGELATSSDSLGSLPLDLQMELITADHAIPMPETTASPLPYWAAGAAPLSMERSSTLKSSASERRLPRLLEEDALLLRPSIDIDARLALKLDVVAGPCSEISYTTEGDVCEVTVGRAPGNLLVINDTEVSGRHAIVSWNSASHCWQIVDVGSLNGTILNGEAIGEMGQRVRGREYRLSTDDIVELGTFTKLKVSVFPRDLLSRQNSLPLTGSMPRSLTMPKHRIPSFNSLLSPKVRAAELAF
jgi:hypothetical protein